MQESNLGRNEELSIQERMEQIAPLLRMLPPGTQVACVQDGEELLLYNINKAFELFAGRPATTTIDVMERAKLIQPRDTERPSDDTALIDPRHAATVDLSYPVMLLESRLEMDGRQGRVIDGWHRIYRAAQLGIAELPAIVITAEDEALIRIDPDAANRESSGQKS
jgi:hypothetical protein